MEIDTVYENVGDNTQGPQKHSHNQDEGKAQKYRGSGCLLGITVSLGLLCVILLLFITLQHISITAERDLHKNTVEELSSLQHNNTHLTLKTLKAERLVTSLSDELNKVYSKDLFFLSDERKNWSESRQYCRGHRADLVIIKNEVKQMFLNSIIEESCWIGLSDIETEGNMIWVDNSPLTEGFWVDGEPNNLGGAEHCVVMNPSDIFQQSWNDVPCSFQRRAICEK